MNIMFFLIPKADVAYIYDSFTLRQVLEKMENHRYTAIPMIGEKNGDYIGTITEGDILWFLKDQHNLNLKDTEDISIQDIRRNKYNKPVKANADMEDLMEKVMNQNFVPVNDDKGRFIGIVTRRDVMQYLMRKVDEIEEKGTF